LVTYHSHNLFWFGMMFVSIYCMKRLILLVGVTFLFIGTVSLAQAQDDKKTLNVLVRGYEPDFSWKMNLEQVFTDRKDKFILLGSHSDTQNSLESIESEIETKLRNKGLVGNYENILIWLLAHGKTVKNKHVILLSESSKNPASSEVIKKVYRGLDKYSKTKKNTKVDLVSLSCNGASIFNRLSAKGMLPKGSRVLSFSDSFQATMIGDVQSFIDVYSKIKKEVELDAAHLAYLYLANVKNSSAVVDNHKKYSPISLATIGDGIVEVNRRYRNLIKLRRNYKEAFKKSVSNAFLKVIDRANDFRRLIPTNDLMVRQARDFLLSASDSELSNPPFDIYNYLLLLSYYTDQEEFITEKQKKADYKLYKTLMAEGMSIEKRIFEVQKAFKNGANPNALFDRSFKSLFASYGYSTPLLNKAISFGSLELVRLFIMPEVNVDFEQEDQKGVNALLTALTYDTENLSYKKDIVFHLLSNGAEIDVFDKNNKSSIMYAFETTDLDIIEYYSKNSKQSIFEKNKLGQDAFSLFLKSELRKNAKILYNPEFDDQIGSLTELQLKKIKRVINLFKVKFDNEKYFHEIMSLVSRLPVHVKTFTFFINKFLDEYEFDQKYVSKEPDMLKYLISKSLRSKSQIWLYNAFQLTNVGVVKYLFENGADMFSTILDSSSGIAYSGSKGDYAFLALARTTIYSVWDSAYGYSQEKVNERTIKLIDFVIEEAEANNISNFSINAKRNDPIAESMLCLLIRGMDVGNFDNTKDIISHLIRVGGDVSSICRKDGKSVIEHLERKANYLKTKIRRSNKKNLTKNVFLGLQNSYQEWKNYQIAINSILKLAREISTEQ